MLPLRAYMGQCGERGGKVCERDITALVDEVYVRHLRRVPWVAQSPKRLKPKVHVQWVDLSRHRDGGGGERGVDRGSERVLFMAVGYSRVKVPTGAGSIVDSGTPAIQCLRWR